MAIKVQGTTVIDDSKNILNVGVATIGSIDVNKISPDGSDFGTSNYVPVADGTGTWSWQSVTSAGAGVLDGITVQEENSTVGTAGSITTLKFVGNNITATAVSGGAIATITASDTPTFDTLGIGTRIDLIPYDTLDNGTLSFEGSAGQLFSITNNLSSGSIFSVNDVSGIPSIDVDADGTIQLAPYGSTEYVGIGTTNPTAKLDVRGTLNVSGVSTFQGNVKLGDNDSLSLGDSGDLALFHNGSHSFVDDNGVGSLYLRSSVGGVFITKTTGDVMGGFNPNGSVELYHNAVKKFETTSGGVTVTGTVTADGLSLGDNDNLYLGDGNDLRIYHDGTDSIIRENGPGSLYIDGTNIHFRTSNGSEKYASFESNGQVELYYDGSKKFETTGIGVSIIGVGNTATITGPANLVLDPGTVGDNTGTVTILGNLQVDGTQTVINSTTMTVDDLNITLADGAANASAANGAGITVDGASATLTYSSTGDKWVFNKSLDVTGNTDTDTLNVSGVSTFGGVIDIGTQKIQGTNANYYIKVPYNANAEFVSPRPIEIRADDDDSSDTEYLLLAAGQNELKVTSTASGGTDANKLTYNGNIVWHAGNDGTGTGLDADTVDGLQATSFIRSDTADTASGVITFSNGDSSFGTGTALSAEFGVNTVGAGAIKLHGTTSNAYGLIQATTQNLHIDTVVGATYLNYYDGSYISFGTGTGGEGGRFTGSTQTLTLGTTSQTGTASQKLQVTGGAYVSGNLGVGITNPYNSAGASIESSGTIITRNNFAALSNGGSQTNSGAFIRSSNGYSTPTTPNYTWWFNDQTGFFHPSSNNIGITIGGTETVRFNSTGVGINTTAPGSTLAVGGTITELYNGSYWNVVTQADVGYGASQVPLNQYLGQLAFLDDHHPNGLRRDGGGSDDVVVSAGGTVGIGTDIVGSSGHALEVIGSVRINNGTGTAIDVSNGGISNVNVLAFSDPGPNEGITWSNGNGWSIYESPNDLTTNSAGNLQFVDSGVRIFTLDTSGNAEFTGNLNVDGTVSLGSSVYDTNGSFGTNGQVLSSVTGFGVSWVNQSGGGGGAGDNITEGNTSAEVVDTGSDGHFKVTTEGTERLRVTSDGKVGIGLTNPEVALQLGLTKGDNQIKLKSSNGNLDMRINPAYGNADVASVTVVGAYPLTFHTNNTERIRIESGGDVGIGTDNPQQKLHVNGSIRVEAAAGNINNNFSLVGQNSSSSADYGLTLSHYQGDTNTTDARVVIGGNGSSIENTIRFYRDVSGTNTETARFDEDGDFGIGTDNPLSKLDVRSTASQAAAFWSVPSASPANFDSSQIFAFNRTGGVSGLTFSSGDTRLLTATVTPDNEVAWRAYKLSLVSTDYISLRPGNGVERVRVTSAGDVGIGITNPSYKLHVNGSFAATTKSFVIDHPTKDGMKLRYGSLEGPENGVYVRGRLKGNNTIELPDHWTGLVDEETITVNLTPIGRKAPLHSVVDIADNTVVVESANDVVDCFYTVFGERKDVEKLEVEF